MLQIADTINDSIVDGPGLRYTVFTQGCSHHCPGCHNPQTWEFTKGQKTEEEILEDIAANPLLQGITLSGGDPFDQPAACSKFVKKIMRANPKLDIWCYTGYTWEQLMDKCLNRPEIADLLGHIDVLVDGPFIEAERNLALLFRGSDNQRIIDVTRSLQQEKVILWEA